VLRPFVLQPVSPPLLKAWCSARRAGVALATALRAGSKPAVLLLALTLLKACVPLALALLLLLLPPPRPRQLLQRVPAETWHSNEWSTPRARSASVPGGPRGS
jgi:hypothetical protein